MCFGKKKKTTTVNTSAPAAVQDRYLSAMQSAEQAAAAPYTSYGTKPEDYVAALNQQQQAGIAGVDATVGGYKPYMQAGVDATNTGMGYMGAGMGTAASGLGSMGTGLNTIGQGIGTAQSGLANMDTGSGYINQGMGTVGQGTGYISQGMGTVGQGVGSIGEGMGATRAGMGPADLGSLDIQRYLSPYLSQVMGSTADLMNQANMQGQSSALGTAISSGAFGGDRAGIAAANLNQQNQLAMGSTLANIGNQGYQFAATTAEGQQAADLAARQANLERMLKAGAQFGQLGATYGNLGAQQGTLGEQQGALGTAMGNLGAQQGTIGAQRGTLGSQIGEMGTAQANVGAQQGTLGTQMSNIGTNVLGAGKQLADFGTEQQRLDLEAAQAQINAGTVEQQNRQAGIDAMMKKFMEEKGYPFQQAQYLAEMYASLGPLWGSTTTTTRPTNIFGTPVKTGGRINGYAAGGGVAGPVSMGKTPIGETSYIPERILPISEILRHLEEAGTGGGGESAIDSAIKVGKFISGFADGGSVDDREGYYDGGMSGQALSNEALRRQKEIRDYLAGLTIVDDIKKEEPMKASINPISLGLNGPINTQTPTGLAPAPNRSDMETDARGQSVRMYTDGHPITSADLALMRLAPTTSPRPLARPEGLAPTTSMRPPARPEGLGAADVTVLKPTVDLGALEGLAPTTSMRPPARPEGLGVADVMTSSMRPPARPVDLGTPVTAVVATPKPAVDLGTSTQTSSLIDQKAPTLEPNPSKWDMADTGLAPTGGYKPIIPLGTQLQFVTSELQQPEYKSYLENTYATPAQAAVAFEQVYERAKGAGNDVAAANATDIYNAARNGKLDQMPPNVVEAYNHFVQTGMDPIQASGAAGRLMVESYSHLDPNARNTLGGGYGTYGIAQWRGDRIEKLANFAGVPVDAIANAPVSTPEGRYYSHGANFTGGVGAGNGNAQGDGLGGADRSAEQDFLNTGKPYEDRNLIGKFFHDKDTGKLDPSAIMSVLTGIGGAMQAQTMSPLNAILQGVATGATTYKDLLKQNADVGLIKAQATRENVNAVRDSFFTVGDGGMPMVIVPGEGPVTLGDFLSNPTYQKWGNPEQEAIVIQEAKRMAATEKEAPTAETPEGNVTPNVNIFSTPVVQGYIKGETEIGSVNYRDAQTKTTDVVNSINDMANTARAGRAANLMQAEAIANLSSEDANVRSGALNKIQMSAISYANSMLDAVGRPDMRISGLEDRQLAEKAAIIASIDRAHGGGQESYDALMNILNANPSSANDPVTNSKIMASLMVSQQRSIDLANFTRAYRMEPANEFKLANDAATAFDSVYRTKILAEEKALEKIILHGSDNLGDGVETTMQFIMDPSVSAAEKNDVIQSALLAYGMSAEQIAAMQDANGQIDLARMFGG